MRHLIIPFLTICFLTESLAFGQRPEISSREACRRMLSGKYMNTYDNVHNNENLQILLGTKIKKLKKGIRLEKIELAKRNADVKTHKFDMARIEIRDNSKTRLNNLKIHLIDLEPRIKVSSDELVVQRVQLKEMEVQLKKLFQIEPLRIDPKGKFPYTIKYKNPCPKYRFICPLPKKQAYQLRDFARQFNGPNECTKYAAFSGAAP